MNSGVEELKLLQTAILMITTNSLVQHESLARVCLVLGSYPIYYPHLQILPFYVVNLWKWRLKTAQACDSSST